MQQVPASLQTLLPIPTLIANLGPLWPSIKQHRRKLTYNFRYRELNAVRLGFLDIL